ncbi:MAG: metallophosphoesterase family protein [Gammaproteobacteria bacterium]|nr:metallophosphoesterase family protein [Gammaproteobacteria bacterium]
MKYKVWSQARAVLKPQKHHYNYFAVMLFALGFIVTLGLAIRLAVLYTQSYYSGSREPYIQSLSSNSVVIRWQSDAQVKARLELRNGINHAISEQHEKSAKTAHEMRFKQLQPATRYYYRIYQNQKLYRGGDEYWFETAPDNTSDAPIRIWLMGNSGQMGDGLKAVKQAMSGWLSQHQRQGQSALNMIISSGDNGDENGSHQGYQAGLFSVHQDVLKNYVYWPVYGEHDASGWSFYNIFSLPEAADSGGVASGTERYYSVDYGPLHLIFLDSHDGGYRADDKMISWLKADLKNNKQKWLLAFMHHPPYTRGSHNSNDPKDSANRMFNMRKRVVPVLEQASVDLVVSGYSHSYERSYLLDCHYGVSSAFKPESILQKGPKFNKPLLRQPHQGSVYIVLGSSADAVAGPFDHPVMAVSAAKLGSMVLDIEKHKLTARFIDEQAQVVDQFEINKLTGASSQVSQNGICQ